MTKINLPDGFNESPVAPTVDRIELPFDYVLAYFKNGSSQFKQFAAANPVAYYGGWVIPGDNVFGLDTFLKDNPDAKPLSGLQPVKADNRDGKERAEYAIRSLAVAPIASRSGWEFEKNGRKVRQADYPANEKAPRAFMQMLVYLFDRAVQDKTAIYTPWNVGLLSVKGWQASYLKEAIKQWEIATLPARTALSDNPRKAVPANAFIVNLGTFGKGPNYVEKGKVAKSLVTPLVAAIPDTITVDTLRYVGDDIAETMATYYLSAADWLNAFAKKNIEEIQDDGDVTQAAHMEAPVEDDDPPF